MMPRSTLSAPGLTVAWLTVAIRPDPGLYAGLYPCGIRR